MHLPTLSNSITQNTRTPLSHRSQFCQDRQLSHLNEVDSALITAAYNFKLASARNDKEPHVQKFVLHRSYQLSAKRLFQSQQIPAFLNFCGEMIYLTTKKRRDAYRSLAAVANARAQHKEAYEYSMKLNRLNDSILNYDRVKAINDLSIKHQADEKSKGHTHSRNWKINPYFKNTTHPKCTLFCSRRFFLLFGSSLFYHSFYSEKIKAEKK